MSGFSRGVLALVVLVALGHAGCGKPWSKPSASQKAAAEPAGKLSKTDPSRIKLIAPQEDPAERAGPAHVLAAYQHQEEPSRFDPHFSTSNNRPSQWPPRGHQPNQLRGATKQVFPESKGVSSQSNVLRSGKRSASSGGSSEPRWLRVEDGSSPVTDRKPVGQFRSTGSKEPFELTPNFSRVFPFRSFRSEAVGGPFNHPKPAGPRLGFSHEIFQSKVASPRSILAREQRGKKSRASFPLPKCQVKAVLRSDNDQTMAVFEVDGFGTYIVHEGSTIVLSNKKPLRVLKIRKITDHTVILTTGNKGQEFVIR